MSTILKALRRIEQEREVAHRDLRGQVVAAPDRSRDTRPRLPLLAVAGASGAALVVLLFMAWDGGVRRGQDARATMQVAAVAPAPRAAVVEPETTPQVQAPSPGASATAPRAAGQAAALPRAENPPPLPVENPTKGAAPRSAAAPPAAPKRAGPRVPRPEPAARTPAASKPVAVASTSGPPPKPVAVASTSGPPPKPVAVASTSGPSSKPVAVASTSGPPSKPVAVASTSGPPPKPVARASTVAAVSSPPPETMLAPRALVPVPPPALAPPAEPVPGIVGQPEVAARLPLRRIIVEQTLWHPDPGRRLALLQVEGRDDLVKLREGDAVGDAVVQQIDPSAVLFIHRGVEIRRRVGASE